MTPPPHSKTIEKCKDIQNHRQWYVFLYLKTVAGHKTPLKAFHHKVWGGGVSLWLLLHVAQFHYYVCFRAEYDYRLRLTTARLEAV